MGDDVDRARLELAAHLIDALPEMVVVLDREARVTFAAGAFMPQTNLGPEDLLGRNAWEIVHPDDVEDSAENLVYLLGYEEGPVGPFVFRYFDREGNVRTADAVGLNRVHDPLIGGTVVLLRDVVGPQAVEQAFESLAAGQTLAVVAGHLLRAVEEPPISGIGWILQLDAAQNDGPAAGAGRRPDIVATSPGARSLGELVTEPGSWVFDQDARDAVIDPDLSSVPEPLRDAFRELGQRSLLAMPVRVPTSTRPDLWLVACNRWEERSTANEIRTIRKHASVMSVSYERLRLQAELHDAAVHDGLTGLTNRAAFISLLEAFGNAPATEAGGSSDCALLFLDLDDFKPINDRLGHHVGDVVLVEVSRRIATCVRQGDVVARLGGDEFAILMPGATAEDAAAVAERIRSAVSDPILAGDSSVAVGISVGIAFGPPTELERLLELADGAMYRAEREGRGQDAAE